MVAHLGKPWSRRRLVTIAAVVLMLAAIVVYWVMYSSQVTESAAGLPTTAERTIVASTDVDYPDLGSLTASSDLVVKGTIEEVTRGGTWTFAPDSGVPASGQVDRLLRISVEEVVYAAGGQDPPGEIFVLEGIWEAGVGIQRAEMPWAQPGRRGYFFLVDYEEYGDDKTFNYVAPTGRVLVDGKRAVAADHHHRLWQAAGLTMAATDGSADLGQAEKAIHGAAARARSGAAKPVPDPEPEPCPRVEVCPRFEPAGRG